PVVTLPCVLSFPGGTGRAVVPVVRTTGTTARSANDQVQRDGVGHRLGTCVVRVNVVTGVELRLDFGRAGRIGEHLVEVDDPAELTAVLAQILVDRLARRLFLR